MKKSVYVFLGIILFSLVSIAFADGGGDVAGLVGDIDGFKLPSFNTPSKDGAGKAIASIIQYGIGLAGVLAIIASTWAAIQMFIATGEDKKFEDAKKLLIHALVGVGLAGGAYAIVSLISGISF